ncbi:MAG: hypothetical protein GY760_15965 [Deltaproteobacteria bacterium]|nr:hypothetical protein [Deltaproteobacteria bacterium]
MSKFNTMSEYSKIIKVDSEQGIVYGWAIVSKIDGEEYFDLQDEHIPETIMLKATSDFMHDVRSIKNMHMGEDTGIVVHSFPMTKEIKKSFGIECSYTGWMVGVKPMSKETLDKFKKGIYTGFSIGGIGTTEEVG